MSYTSPVKETKFILENLLEDNAKIESETLTAVLEEAGKLANDNLVPLYYSGDKNPPKLRQDHEVETSPGYKEAFKTLADGGWVGVSSDTNYEGMGLPFRIAAAVKVLVIDAMRKSVVSSGDTGLGKGTFPNTRCHKSCCLETMPRVSEGRSSDSIIDGMS